MPAFNAARRLHDIPWVSHTLDPSQPAREIWARILGLRPDNRAALFRAIGLVADLVDEVEKTIKARTDVDVDLLLEHMPAIREAVGLMQLDAAWTAHAQRLSEAAIRDLRHCSNAIVPAGRKNRRG